MSRIFLALALIPSLVLMSGTATATGDWSSAILRQDPGLLLEITTDDGIVRTGYAAAATADSLGLAPAPGQPARATVAVTEIVRVRQQRSAAARGWRTGGTIGGVTGAAFGLLASLFINAVSDENTWDNTSAPYVASAVGFAALGAATLGGAGALIGSGSETWYDLETGPAAPPSAWRLEPQAGLAAADDAGGDKYDDLHLRLFLPRRLGSWVEAGPDLGWMRLGTYSESWDGRSASVSDTWQAGGTARFALPIGGVEPYVTLGLGWYHREDSWLGTNWGLGVRINRVTAEVRGHYRSSGLDAEPSNSVMTVACGWTFEL